jgi:hypothetical protein
MREVLVECAHNSGIAGISQQLKRLPEAKGGL